MMSEEERESAMATAAESRSLASLLGEIGMLAAGCGCVEHSEKIFKALALLKPGSEAPAVGRALALMGAGAWDEALATLRAAESPAGDVNRSFQALALRCAGRHGEADRLARRIVDESGGRTVLATALASGQQAG